MKQHRPKYVTTTTNTKLINKHGNQLQESQKNTGRLSWLKYNYLNANEI